MSSEALYRTDPKNEQHLDPRVREVRGVLRSSGYPALARLNCEVRDGAVELSGEVSSFYLKQILHSVLSRTYQTVEVRNLVRVI